MTGKRCHFNTGDCMSEYDCIYIRSHLTISQLAIFLAYTDMLKILTLLWRYCDLDKDRKLSTMLDEILLTTAQIITLNNTLFMSISCKLMLPSGNVSLTTQGGNLFSFSFPLKGNNVFDSFYPAVYLPRMAFDTDVTYL